MSERSTFMSRISAAASARGRVLKSDDGIEVSIPNIIVAVTISLAIIAAVILGVITLVPWAQEGAAKSDLATIQTAQQVYSSKEDVNKSGVTAYDEAIAAGKTPAQATPLIGTYGGAGNFGTGAQLLSSKSILDAKKSIVVGVNTTKDAWCAGTKSANGKTFFAFSGTTEVVLSAKADGTAVEINDAAIAAKIPANADITMCPTLAAVAAAKTIK